MCRWKEKKMKQFVWTDNNNPFKLSSDSSYSWFPTRYGVICKLRPCSIPLSASTESNNHPSRKVPDHNDLVPTYSQRIIRHVASLMPSYYTNFTMGATYIYYDAYVSWCQEQHFEGVISHMTLYCTIGFSKARQFQCSGNDYLCARRSRYVYLAPGTHNLPYYIHSSSQPLIRN